MSRPNFKDLAREWLVRAQGHARPEHEESLAKEIRSAYELGAAHAIEVVHDFGPNMLDSRPLDEIVERIRDATAPKT